MDSSNYFHPALARDRREPVSGIAISAIVASILTSLAWGVVMHRATARTSAALDEKSAQIAALTGQLKTSRDETESARLAILKCYQGDGTKTVIVSTLMPGAREMMANFMVSALAAQSAPQLLGPVLVIPRRIVPTTPDGNLGYSYAYLSADGKVQGWFQPQRGK